MKLPKGQTAARKSAQGRAQRALKGPHPRKSSPVDRPAGSSYLQRCPTCDQLLPIHYPRSVEQLVESACQLRRVRLFLFRRDSLRAATVVVERTPSKYWPITAYIEGSVPAEKADLALTKALIRNLDLFLGTTLGT